MASFIVRDRMKPKVLPRSSGSELILNLSTYINMSDCYHNKVPLLLLRQDSARKLAVPFYVGKQRILVYGEVLTLASISEFFYQLVAPEEKAEKVPHEKVTHEKAEKEVSTALTPPSFLVKPPQLSPKKTDVVSPPYTIDADHEFTDVEISDFLYAWLTMHGYYILDSLPDLQVLLGVWQWLHKCTWMPAAGYLMEYIDRVDSEMRHLAFLPQPLAEQCCAQLESLCRHITKRDDLDMGHFLPIIQNWDAVISSLQSSFAPVVKADEKKKD